MVKSGKFVELLDSQDFCKILRRKIVKSEEIGKLSISGARGQWVLRSLRGCPDQACRAGGIYKQYKWEVSTNFLSPTTNDVSYNQTN